MHGRDAPDGIADDEVLEDWVHDAAGNVTFQESGATDPVWYAGSVTTPHREYRDRS